MRYLACMDAHSFNARGARPAWHYTMPAIVLHWTLAVLIAFMAGLGWYMMTVEHDPSGPWFIDLHKSVGLIVLALVLVRLAWRAGHRPEPLPPSMPQWQVTTARLTHVLLYVCMLVMTVTGLLGASYQKSGLAFFGLALPRWAQPDRDLSHLLFDIHSTTVWVLVALVVLHAAAALKHVLDDRDEVFSRMWPARWRRAVK